jgi:anti-sigma factor RsiW
MAALNTELGRLSQKTCKEITDLVSNYLNDGLEARLKRQFEEHLRICPDCVAFLKTFQKTVSAMRSVRAEDMPENVRRNILGFLQRRVRRRRTRA